MTTKQYEELCLAGLGATCAGILTNPLEVIKIRIQLQGELKPRGQYTVHYTNVFQAFYTVAKAESLASLQKGLAPALFYQFIMNGCRFGAYQVLDNKGYVRNQNGDVVLTKSVLSSLFSGGLGAFLANPFYLMRVHLQSKSAALIAVGYQHNYSTMREGMGVIFKEQGVRGFWLGGGASIMRGSVCGSVQMTSFTILQAYFNKSEYFAPQSPTSTMVSSVISSSLLCLVSNPVDVISNRICNQEVDLSVRKGVTYNGIGDCIVKIFKTEGMYGFYKGFTASLIKNGPHTMLAMLFWQFFRKQYLHYCKESNTTPTTSSSSNTANSKEN